MKNIILFGTLLHVFVIFIDGTPLVLSENAGNNDMSSVYEYAQSLNVPVVVVVVQQTSNPNQIYSDFDGEPKKVEDVEQYPIKQIARHIRELRDIRHEPEYSSSHFLQRRRNRCHIMRRVCIIGQCASTDLECLHHCRLQYAACYQRPTFDDVKFPPREPPERFVSDY